ncbi:MAG: penicillin-insensitive murein endopeptidase [Deltaproteobacteria bacterium]|nr:penicillin-insensitive murein endopeptidase [Deltaproteobacteria bacterium]
MLVLLLAGADLSAAPAKQRPHRYTHEVMPGETLYEIARRYNVSMESLRRWNPRRVGKNDRIKAGTKLEIRSTVPIRTKRKAWYVVQKGDSLKRIAKRLNTTVRDLRSLNGLRKDIIRTGQKLAYLVPGPEKDSKSVGSPSSGRLVDGEKMPEGPGYSYGTRPNVYGTNETITHLIECIGKYRRKYPDGPDIVMGNLSRPAGGHLDPHRSHESGRDVDLGYIHKAKLQPVTSMINTNASNLDSRKTWFLMQCFLDTGDLDVIYVDLPIQEALVKYLKEAKYKQRFIDKVFQWPRTTRGEAVIQEYEGHHHHMHVRFKCPRGDGDCVE